MKRNQSEIVSDVEDKLGQLSRHDRIFRGAFTLCGLIVVAVLITGFWLLRETKEEYLLRTGPPAGWLDRAYLARYPDVAQAVRMGKFDSGWHHYVMHGRKEGRLGANKRKQR